MINAYKQLLSIIKSSQATRVEQLHQFCEINSGTSNLSGLMQLTHILHAAYKPIADTIQIKHCDPFPVIDMLGNTQLHRSGHTLFIRKRPHLKRRVLLCGHMDTVYSAESSFQKLIYLNNNCINGPGVSDMKGGLIVMLHALSAFEQHEDAINLGWDVLINADEEIGSPASSLLLDELATGYQAALVYEPALTEKGTFAKNRKGNGKLTLVATGRSAHAGRDFEQGRNAIYYLTEAVNAINALNKQHNGVTINAGKIAGGTALNIVPDKAVAQFDVRINLPEDELWVKTKLDKIIQQLKRQDYSLSLHSRFSRPVKRINLGTERLFHRIQHVGKKLGLSIDWKDSGGCCDGNNLAKYGIPVVDTLGVRGGNIHSEEEYILLDSLAERTALSTLLLLDLAQGSLEELKK